jgi:hypothetical protein
MRIARYTILGVFIGIFIFNLAFSQQAGDYRSLTSGDWSAAATWETFDGSNWVPASSPPAGTENITVDDQDTVRVDGAVTISGTGYVLVTATGVIETTTGSLTFEDGTTYEHDRNGGSVPAATWGTGSTALFTGITSTAPDNRGQDYYNLTLNTPDLTSNRDMDLVDVTIGGDINVVNTGSARWRMVGGDTTTINIMGEVNVQAGAFETQGTSNPTVVEVNHYGDLNVTGGIFGISRGSQGSGTGSTTWNLFGGNLLVSDAELRNSNPTAGNAKFVFAGADTQQITFSNVTYGGGDIHFKVADSSTMQITQDMDFNGYVINEGTIDAVGTPNFIDGGVYEHARNGGSVPTAIWGTGSTALFTGITSTAPDNRGQDYYNLTLDTPDLTSNRDMDLVDVTIGGDINVVNTGSARWRMVGGDSTTINIMGDVNVQAGSFETQGTSNPTVVEVNHYGDLNVTGGTFGISRGSQASGTGTTTWNLFEGNLTVSDAELRNSNPTPGNAKFVFAKGDTQQITFTNVDYGGGDIHFKVADSSTMQITQNMDFNGYVINEGSIDAVGTPTFIDGGVYEHARDGGEVPTAIWGTGSTALFTGITGTAPDNRGQNYYNLTLNTPDLGSNRDMDLVDVTIGGDITVISSGSSRWRLVGGDTTTITIMGDVIVEGGSFETQGTSSPTVVVVDHYGDVVATGGTFAVSRGSQGSGTGSTRWYMHEGNFSVSDAHIRNSNPTNAWFVFDKDTTQNVTLNNVDFSNGGFPIEVAAGTTLDFGLSEVGGDGLFMLNTGAAIATANAAGIDSTIKTTGAVTLSDSASYIFNGTDAQITGFLMPDTVMNLTIDNAAGVVLSQSTVINGVLRLVAGVFDNTISFTLGPDGSISYEGGSLLVPVVPPADYRSVASGNWSAAATWEFFNGSDYVPASNPPTGTETIVVDDQDTVSVDVAVSITDAGYVAVTSEGVIEITTGSLTFGNGTIYDHARDAGSVPTATWDEGSTALFTGITSTAPDNRGQDYYNITLNTPGLTSNEDLDLVDKTIGGNITVVNTGISRWRLVGGDTATVTIMGDVDVQGGSFETLGTGSPTVVEVNHYGNINVTGGTFGISRGSQGNGLGSTTWNLFGGNLLVSDAELRNSNPTAGNAKFVFAGADTQQITFSNVTYGGGDIHFKVADSSTMQITQDMDFNGYVINEGDIDAVGTPTFIDGGVYEHARDGGDVPMAVWDVGSTALFTGITTSTPGNRGQDYYNLTLNTPGLLSNKDMDLVDVTIGGDINVISSGSARWRLVGGDTTTITIMGDVIVQDGSLETQGTSSPTVVVVDHYGDVIVTGGTFAVSRGSQLSGTGSTRWYMHEGNFSVSDAHIRNSNPTNAWFVFDKDTTQNVTLNNVDFSNGGFPIEVAAGTTLDFGLSEVGGNGLFMLDAGATMATANSGGVDSTIQTVDTLITLSQDASFTFNGTDAQVTGFLMPDTVDGLTIDNPDTVTLSQGTRINGVLRLKAGVFDNTILFTLGPNGSISYEGGSLLIPVSIEGPTSELPRVFALYQNYPNPFNPATTIRYDIPKQALVTVKIYDILGREVAELVNGPHAPGAYQVIWNASGYATGIYYYRIKAGDFVSVRKLVLMK